jgi:uncharacterized protein (DUF1800 family)/uncharacterized protein (DUF1501 family)
LHLNRRQFIHLGGGAALGASLTGCDQLPSELFLGLKPEAEHAGPFLPPTADYIDPIRHALNRLTFGARPEDYAAIKALNPDPDLAVQQFIETQLHPETIDDDACHRVVRLCERLDDPPGEMFEYNAKVLLEEMVRATILRAVLSRRQLQETMCLFWTDHFNIDPSKGDAKWLKAADDREVIRRHALGRFPDLLRASALSPAMLWYLDGRVNRRESQADRPNENYARELLELHTLGVHGGYTQQDVMEVARCLTGWTVRTKGEMKLGTVEFKAHRHDDGPKEVLGHSIPAGLGPEDLDRVLDIVALHPSTGRYIATKLCRRFIVDDPPSAAIDAVAVAFQESQGDIRQTLKALFATPEFHQFPGQKFKRPFKFIVSALRATAARTDAGQPIMDYLLRMGHAPFHYPTPDGYPEEANPWMGTLLWRWNFATALSSNRIKGTRVQTDKLLKKMGQPEQLMAHILGRRPNAVELESYHRSGAGLALALSPQTFITGNQDQTRALIVVFLRGGADGLSLVAPVEDDDYQRLRLRLGIPQADALKLDDLFGFNPLLKDLHPLYEEGGLAVVHAAGSEDQTRSHFEAQDLMEHGGLVAGGWLGRFLRYRQASNPGALSALALGRGLPECLRGAPAATVLDSIDDFSLGENQENMSRELARLYQLEKNELGRNARDTLKALERIETLRGAPYQPEHGVEYAEDRFSSGLRQIARLIKAQVGLEAVSIDLGGWDSHFTQGTLITPLMSRLGAGLKSFYRDLGAWMNTTTVVVMTEFGRRVRENASFGTDHGRGSVMFVLGGGINGGHVLGQWPGLKEEVLEGPGDLPVMNNYRNVLAPILQKHGATSPDNLTRIFPEFDLQPLAMY